MNKKPWWEELDDEIERKKERETWTSIIMIFLGVVLVLIFLCDLWVKIYQLIF